MAFKGQVFSSAYLRPKGSASNDQPSSILVGFTIKSASEMDTVSTIIGKNGTDLFFYTKRTLNIFDLFTTRVPLLSRA